MNFIYIWYHEKYQLHINSLTICAGDGHVFQVRFNRSQKSFPPSLGAVQDVMYAYAVQQ